MQHPTLRPRRLFPVANAFRQPQLTPSQSPALSSTPCSSLTTSSSDSALSIPFDHLTIQDQDLYRLITVKYDGGPYPHAPSHAPLGPVVRLEALEHLVEERMLDKSSRVSADEAPSSYHIPSTARPLLLPRNSSFSKQHASFDTPREVPLPYMPSPPHHTPYAGSSTPSHSRTNSADQDTEALSCMSSRAAEKRIDTAYSGYDCPSSDESRTSSDSLPSVLTSSSGSSMQRTDTPMDVGPGSYYVEMSEASTSQYASTSSLQQYPRSAGKAISSPVQLFSRPSSSPDASAPALSRIHSPTPVRPSVPDRGSTASLPLPMHTPFHTLPPSSEHVTQEDRAVGTSPQAGLSRMSISPYRHPSSGPSLSAMFPLGDLAWMYDRNASPPLASPINSDSHFSVSTPSAAVVTERSMPPPAPPTVLTPPPSNEERCPRAPHDSFLAHSPPPTDSYIAVETNPHEYKLLVRLPGFRRDAITLSTRKRRILHVVADSWEPGGGHFERRISFGYDADLAQVRAEFDGEFLRVIVPRRALPAAYWNPRV